MKKISEFEALMSSFKTGKTPGDCGCSEDMESKEFAIGVPNVIHQDGGRRNTNRVGPYCGGERGDIKYRASEYNKTRSEACECGPVFGGYDFNIC